MERIKQLKSIREWIKLDCRYNALIHIEEMRCNTLDEEYREQLSIIKQMITLDWTKEALSTLEETLNFYQKKVDRSI